MSVPLTLIIRYIKSKYHDHNSNAAVSQSTVKRQRGVFAFISLLTGQMSQQIVKCTQYHKSDWKKQKQKG
jgi:hypothetical protein